MNDKFKDFKKVLSSCFKTNNQFSINKKISRQVFISVFCDEYNAQYNNEISYLKLLKFLSFLKLSGIFKESFENDIECVEFSKIPEIKEEINAKKIFPQTHFKYIYKLVKNYDGPDKDKILYIPKIYQLFSNLLNDPKTDWHSRILIAGSLGYFYIQPDVIEDTSDFGYYDDIYLFLRVLYEISKNQGEQLILDNWEYEVDYIKNLTAYLSDISNSLNEYDGIVHSILSTAGFDVFLDLRAEDYSNIYSINGTLQLSQKRELIAYAAYLLKKAKEIGIFEKPQINSIFISHYDYNEMNKILSIYNYDNNIRENIGNNLYCDYFVEYQKDQLSSFKEYISNEINKNENKFAYLTNIIPELCSLLLSILEENSTNWFVKIQICAALGYLTLENDFVPDSDNNGYLDDLYLIIYVIDKIIYPHENFETSDETQEYTDYLYPIIKEVKQISADFFGYNRCKILNLIGLRKFYSLDLFGYTPSPRNIIKKNNQEKKYLILLIMNLVKIIYNTQLFHTFEEIQKFFAQIDDQVTIRSMIDISNQNHEILKS